MRAFTPRSRKLGLSIASLVLLSGGVSRAEPPEKTVACQVGGVIGDGPLAVEAMPGVLNFGEKMTRPEIDRDAVTRGLYTTAAINERVEGLVIVRCTVRDDGRIQDCVPRKKLPHLTDALVARLTTMKARPATLEGKPVTVRYVFNFRFTLPQSG